MSEQVYTYLVEARKHNPELRPEGTGLTVGKRVRIISNQEARFSC